MKASGDNRARLLIAFAMIMSRSKESSSKSPQDFADLGVKGKPSLKSGKYLFNLDDGGQSISDMHDLGFMMEERGVDATWDYLTQVIIPTLNEQWEVMSKDIKLYAVKPYSEIVFLSPLLDEQRRREDIAMELNKDEGVLTDAASCPRCGAKEVNRKIAQTRSADEGLSSIYKCPKCKFPWTEN